MHSGVGGGVAYRTESEMWKVGLTYGYGIDAEREHEHGAHVVGMFVQFDFEKFFGKRRSRPWFWEVQ